METPPGLSSLKDILKITPSSSSPTRPILLRSHQSSPISPKPDDHETTTIVSSTSCQFDLSLKSEENTGEKNKESTNNVMMVTTDHNPSSSSSSSSPSSPWCVVQNRHVVSRKVTKSAGGGYPPPITCFKLFKQGKPYTYLNYNEEDGTYVVEEVKIPKEMFHASREGGRLQLFCAHSDEEEEEEEEGGGDDNK